MAIRRYKINDPASGEFLGYMHADDSSSPESLQEQAAGAVEQLRAMRIAKLSKPNLEKRIKCQVCPDEPGTFLRMDTPEFHEHMQKHNVELNLGENIE